MRKITDPILLTFFVDLAHCMGGSVVITVSKHRRRDAAYQVDITACVNWTPRDLIDEVLQKLANTSGHTIFDRRGKPARNGRPYRPQAGNDMATNAEAILARVDGETISYMIDSACTMLANHELESAKHMIANTLQVDDTFGTRAERFRLHPEARRVLVTLFGALESAQKSRGEHEH